MWIYNAYAAKGKHHEKLGLPCQDATRVQCKGNILIGAVADGAGSTTHGGMGAQLAVDTFIAFCKQHLETFTPRAAQDLCRQAYGPMIAEITKAASYLKVDIHQFATTFIGIIAAPNGTVVCHCGDGFIVGRTHETYELIDRETDKEFVNQTSFITDENHHFQVKVLKTPLEFIAAGTDGLMDVSISQGTHTPHEGFFKPFDLYLKTKPPKEEIYQELKDFLYSPRLDLRTQDDKSLLIARWVNE